MTIAGAITPTPGFVVLYFKAGGWYWPARLLEARIRSISNTTLRRALEDPRNSSDMLERLAAERARRLAAGETFNL